MRFLLQPLGDPVATHLAAIRSMLEAPELDRLLFASAFVRRSGVEQIEEALAKRGGEVCVVAGIDNGVTSRQGLQALVDSGVKVFTLATETRARIFHPKIFLGWGLARARIISGSANLTLSGLCNNIEASLDLELDLAVPESRALVEAVQAAFERLPTEYPDHCKQLTPDALQDLLNSDRVEDEDARPEAPEWPMSGRANALPPRQGEPIPLPPLVRPRAGGRAAVRPAAPRPGVEMGAVARRGALVWEKPKLKGTDAQRPPGPASNPTGNLRLAQARYKVPGASKPIDQRTYFRHEVFGKCEWEKEGTTEYARALFQIVLPGKPPQTFRLQLSHDLKRVAHQNNVPTLVHWGRATETIENANVVGKKLRLYAPGPEPDDAYTIEFV